MASKCARCGVAPPRRFQRPTMGVTDRPQQRSVCDVQQTLGRQRQSPGVENAGNQSQWYDTSGAARPADCLNKSTTPGHIEPRPSNGSVLHVGAQLGYAQYQPNAPYCRNACSRCLFLLKCMSIPSQILPSTTIYHYLRGTGRTARIRALDDTGRRLSGHRQALPSKQAKGHHPTS